MKAVNKGFTLIELMIVVAVIGVLAAIAIPQYQNYVAKSELAAAYSTLSALKTNTEDYLANKSTAITAATDIQAIQPSDSNVGVITAAGGAGDDVVLTYTFGTLASTKIGNGSTLTLTKANSDGAWSCGVTISDTTTTGLLPKGCKVATASGG